MSLEKLSRYLPLLRVFMMTSIFYGLFFLISYNGWTSVLFAGFLSAGLEARIRKSLKDWKRRAEESNCPRWRILVNDVEVGTISDAEYAQLQLAAFRDRRFYFRQVCNLFAIARQIFNWLVYLVPGAVFWLVFLGFVFWPREFAAALTEFVATVQDKGLAPFANSALIQLFTLSLAGTVFFEFMFGQNKFGFMNHHAVIVVDSIRERLKVPVIGTMTFEQMIPVGVAISTDTAGAA
ncbi:MAG: hypothetical protein F8N36_14210 [Desulfovibrio sp.]|uniref:hypothetical protein n=1 Tax=Desulfovibrio sp. TaxID=885 RepID=UPI00135D89AE|nr:hypothetical protein [Desulfovibrio sp.]MTJ93992.1 hypothetical protein [Desulfovibrio sp.]